MSCGEFLKSTITKTPEMMVPHGQQHWVMVMMDQFTRRIVGFAVHDGDLDGGVVSPLG